MNSNKTSKIFIHAVNFISCIIFPCIWSKKKLDMEENKIIKIDSLVHAVI